MFFCKIKIACGNKFEEIGAKELLCHGFFEDVLFGLDDLPVSAFVHLQCTACQLPKFQYKFKYKYKHNTNTIQTQIEYKHKQNDALFGLDDLQVSRIAQQDAKAMFGIHPTLMTFNPAPLNYTIQAKILHYTSKILSPRIFKTSILHRGHKFSMDLVNGLSQLPPYGGC